MKTFIVSGAEINKRLLTASCKKFNFDIHHFPTDEYAGENIPEKLIKGLNEIKPEILFIDESFLGTTNSELIPAIKMTEGLEKLFIIYTAQSTSLSVISRKIGADAFLPIPFSAVKLESVLRQAISLPKKILLVGKAEITLSPLKNELQKLGFHIHFAESGDLCMQLTHELFPDLILTEYELFDMKGPQLCRKIKSTDLANHIPVFILFKGNSSDIIEDCFNMGAQDVLLHPINSVENIDRITETVSPPARGKREKALVIDDSPMIRGLITDMFKQQGFIVTSAENGLEGLKAAKKVKPDIITCDYDMPIMNGWDFCIEAKQDPEIEAPIIMVSARGTDVDKKKGRVLGVTAYLSKPFKEESLKRAVASAIAEKKRKMEREAITKYLAGDVLSNVADIIDGVKTHAPEEKRITVLFSDICSFTAKCERLSARAVVKLLNEYFDLMIKIIQANNGIVDKLIGDAIVARFNCGDEKIDALNAVRSAHGMLVRLKKFNEESLEPVQIRVGINTGNLILGNIGCESFRLDYTMIGDTVNIGQRLESQADKMGCLISAETYRHVKEFVEVGEVRELSLKGKEVTVKAFPLLNVSEGPDE